MTIAAILSTIWFISYLNYTSQTRDAVRWADLTNMNRILSIHNTSRLVYPSASEAVNISYSGTTLWSQWIFGSQTVAELGKIFGDLIDPKYENKYTYSVTNNKKEYQLWALFENQEAISTLWSSVAFDAINLVNQSYASNPFSPKLIECYFFMDK